jgi:two-component system, OmpR family, response regulator
MTFRILHIDDDADIREIVQFSLALDPGLTLMSCASGGDALAIAAEWAPDLILCDVMMPSMDGPTTLARLRENPKTAKTPIVFMTARAGLDELRHLMSLGATAVFTKPSDEACRYGAGPTEFRRIGCSPLWLRRAFALRCRSAGELSESTVRPSELIHSSRRSGNVRPQAFRSCRRIQFPSREPCRVNRRRGHRRTVRRPGCAWNYRSEPRCAA